MPCCDSGRNIQKYKGSGSDQTTSNLQNILENGNVATLDIVLQSPGIFVGDGGGLSNINLGSAIGTLQTVTDNGNVTSNTVRFINAHTAFTTDLNSNVLVKLDQLSNVIITDPDDHKSLVYNSGNWIDDYIDFTSVEVQAGENLVKGDIVYVSGATGDTPIVHKADSSDSTKMPAIGVVMDGSINQNDNGHVVTFGVFSMPSLDPNFQVGEILYVSNTAVGKLMNTTPFGNTDKIQNVGICVKSGGKILVTGVGRANDIPNAEIVTSQPSYIYVNSTGNELKKIEPSLLNTKTKTLQDVTDTGNTTTNIVQFSNTTTSLVTSSNIKIGSNVSIAGLIDPNKQHLTMVGTDGFLKNAPTYVDPVSGKYVINAAEAEISGNLTLAGNTTVFTSNNVVIEDRIFGIGVNNAVHDLDTGIIMEHDDSGTYANVGIIYHPPTHELSLGYTQNTTSDNHVLNMDNQELKVQVYGNLFVQNNFTVVNGSLNGDGSGITNSNASNISLGTLAVDHGGTGLTSYNTGDILYADSSTSLSKLSPGTAGYVLTTKGTSNAPTWENPSSTASGTIANLYTDDYITGGPWSGITDANLRVVANVQNFANQLVARDSKGDIFVSNVNAINIYGDGTGITSSNASNIDSGVLSNLYGGTGFNTYNQGDLLVGTNTNQLTKLPVSTTVGDVLTVNSSGNDFEWSAPYQPNLQQVTDTGNTTSNTVQFTNTSVSFVTDSNVGIANTAPTSTLDVGEVLSVVNTTSGGDVLILRGNAYFNDEIYIVKKLTVPAGGEIIADQITVRSLSTKGSIVIAERPPTSGILLN
jgi:hypothetical protein